MMLRSGWLLTSYVVLASGNYNNGSNAGVWYRNGNNNNWNNDNNNVSFRAAG